MQIVANNKKAFFEYFILEKIEAGIQLTGDEVKSLRVGKASIKEAYAEAKKGQLFLVNSDISNYEKASSYSKLNSKRVRKLLVHKKEISKLQGKIEKEGMTIVPLKLYFNKKGIAKVQIIVGKGKKQHDKRHTKKTRDWNREKSRVFRKN